MLNIKKILLLINGVLSLPLFIISTAACILGSSSRAKGIYNALLYHSDLRNKVAIVTGSNTGIGQRTAASLSKLGATVILACRDEKRGKEAVELLVKELESCNERNYPHACEGQVLFVPLDLSSLVSVVSFCQVMRANYKHIDVLVNNAGLNVKGITGNGLQQLFQVNYLGHYLLVRLLQPLLKASKDGGRVVNLSSVMHHTGQVDFAKSAHGFCRGDEKENFNCYCDSKLYMNFLTLELNKRYCFNSAGTKEGKIFAVSANPGAVQSDIWRHIPQPVKLIFELVTTIIFLSTSNGCATSVMAALVPSQELEEYHRTQSQSPTAVGSFGCIPGFSRSYHPLIPYYVPYFAPFQFFGYASELMGPYAGPRLYPSSNPPNVSKISEDLWKYSSDLCIQKLREAWKSYPEKLNAVEGLLKD